MGRKHNHIKFFVMILGTLTTSIIWGGQLRASAYLQSIRNETDKVKATETYYSMSLEQNEIHDETTQPKYIISDFVNNMLSSETVSTSDSAEDVQFDSSVRTATGKILVVGEDGDQLSSALAAKELSSFYTDSVPEKMSFEYIENMEEITDTALQYDCFIFEARASGIELDESLFCQLALQDGSVILYDSSMEYEKHSVDGDFHFDTETGTLITSTVTPFIGSETYYTGTYTQYRTLSIPDVFASDIKTVKFLPTYPAELIDLGSSATSLTVNTDATEIVIPNSIQSIKSGFASFNTMQSINLECVTDIADNAFSDCTALGEVDLSSALRIGKEAFKNDEQLHVSAFHKDVSLEQFSFYKGYSGQLILPENLQSVPAMCFAYSNVSEITVNSSLQCIGLGAFYECPIHELKIPENVIDIRGNAFNKCSLQTIDINTSKKLIIQERAFYACDELQNVNFSLKDKNSIIQVSSDAFSECGENATYKTVCLVNQSINQIFTEANNNPVQPPKFPIGGEIQYVGCISFDANGGNVQETPIVYGWKYGSLPTPSRSGYTFSGWYYDDIQIHEGDYINGKGDITLVAKWQSNSILGEEKVFSYGNRPKISTDETLKVEPLYYNNRLLESSFSVYLKDYDEYEDYCWNSNNFTNADKKNAEMLFSKVYNTSESYTKVILNPYCVSLTKDKYKKNSCIIETGLDTDSFIRAVSLMNIIYFQNLNYMHKITNPALKKGNNTVTSYVDLMAGITADNATQIWRTNQSQNSYVDYKVADFECNTIRDGNLHYVVKLKKFKDYYRKCKWIDDQLNMASTSIGLNKNTTQITITDAAYQTNTYLHENYGYDHFYKSYDLYWFFQPESPTDSEESKILTYYHQNEGDVKRDHHGICQSYAFFACALFAKYGYSAPGWIGCDENAIPTHIYNQFVIDGNSLFVDYCWNADINQSVDCTRYMFMAAEEIDVLDNHHYTYLNELYKNILDFNGNDSEIQFKKVKALKIKKKHHNQFVIRFNKTKCAEKYEIQYSLKKNFDKAKSIKTSKNKIIIKNLKRKCTYYFRVRAYCRTSYLKSIKKYGAWSNIKKKKL